MYLNIGKRSCAWPTRHHTRFSYENSVYQETNGRWTKLQALQGVRLAFYRDSGYENLILEYKKLCFVICRLLREPESLNTCLQDSAAQFHPHKLRSGTAFPLSITTQDTPGTLNWSPPSIAPFSQDLERLRNW